VTVTSDLHSATVYVGVLGNAEQQKKGFAQLNLHRKRIQGLVGKAVVLKYTPQLRFVLDESIEQGNRVLKIIDELEHSEPADETTPKDH
jgi:ribosome-binding factor A